MLNLLVTMNTPNSPLKSEVGGAKKLKNLQGFVLICYLLIVTIVQRADRSKPPLLY